MLPNKQTNKIALYIIFILVASFLALFWQESQKGYDVPIYEIKRATNEPDAKNDLSICGLKDVICPIEDEITIVALGEGWTKEEARVLIDLAMCESSLDPLAVGGLSDCFHGLYQWNTCVGGIGIDDTCANDITCSTIKTIKALDKGEYWRWPVCLNNF